MSNRQFKAQAAKEHNELESRLDALFEPSAEDNIGLSPDREAEVQRNIIERMLETYQNTLVQSQLEMRIASRLKDEQMIQQVRKNAHRCFEAIDELKAALVELDGSAGVV